jgi:transposase-like protein
LLLEEMGYGVADAESAVAKKYEIEPNTLHQWKKEKSSDLRIQEIIARPRRQFQNLKRLSRPPSLEGMLAEIKKAGEIFKEARTKKSAKKNKSVKTSK